MLQTLMVKLDPTKNQYQELVDTMHRFNGACNDIAETIFELHSANKINLHKAVYYDIRKKYGLSSQLTVRAISKVAEAYKRDKAIKPNFRPDGAIVYDQRILSWKGLEKVSITTLNGRKVIPIRLGDYQRVRMDRVKGQCDLILVKGIFYLCVVVDAPEESIYDPVGALGVDLGIKNLAVDSDGEVHSGEQITKTRNKLDLLKANLQSKGTKSAKRHLKKLSKRMAKFTKDTNHCISKNLVAKAKDTTCLISIENLKHIRERSTVRKSQRRDHHSWSFSQLREFVTYKAIIAGVPLVYIDPAYTSQECPICHSVSKSNRPSRGEFKCVTCGFSGYADHIAARNIAAKVNVNLPIVSGILKHSLVSPQAQALPL